MVRTIRNAVVAITAATSSLVSETKSAVVRVVLEISNLNAPGGDDVYVAIDEEAKANTGRRVQPGQTITWSSDGGYRPPQGRVTAIATNATNISVYEEIEV